MVAAKLRAASCLFALIPLLGPEALGQEDLGRYLTNGLKDARQRLQQGVFRVSGRWSRRSERGVELDMDVDVFCALDATKELLRFDQRGPVHGPRDDGIKDATTKVIRSRDKEIVWASSTSPDDVYYRVPGKKENYPPECQLFDIRAIGVGSIHEVWTAMIPFEVLFNYRTKTVPSEVTKESATLYRLNWRTKDKYGDEDKTTLWINESQGFAPVRYELSVLGYTDTCEVTWVERDGVWVPDTCAFESSARPKQHESLHLKFTWESVNKPIPAELFELSGLELPAHVVVTDHRVSPPASLGKFGDLTRVEVAKASEAARGSAWRWVAGVGAVVALLLAALWLRSRRSVGA